MTQNKKKRNAEHKKMMAETIYVKVIVADFESKKLIQESYRTTINDTRLTASHINELKRTGITSVQELIEDENLGYMMFFAKNREKLNNAVKIANEKALKEGWIERVA